MEKNLKDLIDSMYQASQPSAELEQKIALFKEEIDRLNFTIKEQKILIQTQKEKIEKAQDIESLEKKVTELTNQLLERKDSSNQNANTEDFSLTQTVVAELSEDNENLQRKVQELSEQLVTAQNEAGELRKLAQNAGNIGQLTQENKDLLQKLQEAKENISQLQNQSKESKPIEEKDALIAQLNQENEDLFRKFQKANFQISELQASIVQIKEEKEEELRKVQGSQQQTPLQQTNVGVNKKQMEEKNAIIELLMQEKSDLLQELDTSYELVTDLQTKVVDSKQIKEKEAIISQLNDHNSELNKKIQEANEKLSDLQGKTFDSELLAEKEDTIAQLVQENERILDQLKSANDEIQQLKQSPHENELKKVTEDLKLANQKLSYLKEENGDLQSQVSFLQRELDGTEEVEETPEMAKREDDFMTALQKSLEDENSKLKKELENANATINTLLTEKKEKESKPIDIPKEICDRDAKIKDLNEKVELFRQQIDKLKIEFNGLLEREHGVEQGFSNEEGTNNEMVKTLTEENARLNTLLSGLKSKEKIPLNQEQSSFNFDINAPKEYQTWLFSKNMALLNEEAKKSIKSALLSSLKNDNIEIKRFALNLLKGYNDDDTFEAISALTNDKNWLVRYSAVKALATHPMEKSRKIFEALSQDPDVDIREFVRKNLKYLK